MNENLDEIDLRLKRGLEDIPVRKLRPDFDEFVIAASRRHVPWYAKRSAPRVALSLACAAVAVMLAIAVIVHLRQAAILAYHTPGALTAPGTLPDEDTIQAPPSAQKAAPTTHYGSVIGTP